MSKIIADTTARARLHLLITASLVAMPATAFAQGAQYGRPLDTPENRASMVVRGSSACVVNEVPSSVRKVLSTEIASDQEAKAVKMLRVVARKCYQAQWPEFPATAVRNAIAEVIYRQEHRGSKPTVGTTPPPASFGVVPAGRTGTPTQEAAWTLAAIARCTVFADIGTAHDFITGPANVSEEDRRFALLKPALSRCVAPQQMAQLNARTLRGFIADALLTQVEGHTHLRAGRRGGVADPGAHQAFPAREERRIIERRSGGNLIPMREAAE